MKKTIGLFLFLMMGIALLAACGSPVNTLPETNTSPTPTPTPTGAVISGTNSNTSNLSLQISMEGVINIPDFVSGTYGPDTATIPLELKQDGYEGSYSGEFHAKISGECNATVSYPVVFQVSAKEDASNNLNFSVNASIAIM